jgi:hypothetical protein
MSKVYCKNCKHRWGYDCTHPEHIIYEDNPLERTWYYPNYRVMNENNDCKYWEEEPSLVSFILNIFRRK